MHLVEQVLLGVIVFSIASLIWNMVQARRKQCKSLIILNILYIIVTLVSLAYLFMIKKQVHEQHVSEPFTGLDLDSTEMVSKYFNILKMQDATENASSTSSVLNKILESDLEYSENMDTIGPGLVLYYTAFSKTSYPIPTLEWRNISKFFVTPDNSCPDVRISETHLKFDMEPSYSREKGFSLTSNSIKGPKCHQLGISAKDSFTIFTTINFSTFIPNPLVGNTVSKTTSTTDVNNINEDRNVYEIFKLYANTINNMGICFYIDDNVVPLGGTYGVKFVVEYGSQDPLIASKTDEQVIYVNPAHVYMFVLVKTQSRIMLYMYENMNNIDANPQSKTLIIDKGINIHEDVLLSNKNMILNRNKNIVGSIFNLGVYNKALGSDEISLLFLHVQAEFQKSNQLLKKLANEIKSIKDAANRVRMCPYTSAVCQECDSIKDWTNTTNVIMNGSTQCLEKIDKFCTINPKHEQCVCWNPDSALSKTTQCKNYVNIFRKNKYVSPDDIDRETLEIIKSKHNLCNCSDVELLKKLVKEQQQEQPKPRRYRNSILSSEYKIDNDAIAIYESGKVDNYFDTTSKKPIDDRYLLKNPFEGDEKKKTKEDSKIVKFVDDLFM